MGLPRTRWFCQILEDNRERERREMPKNQKEKFTGRETVDFSSTDLYQWNDAVRCIHKF